MIDVESALAALSLDERCAVLAGATTWRTHAFPAADVPAVKMSDGPTGIRGEGHGSNGVPGVAVPAGITLGASWDPDLLGEIGDLLGREAVRKCAHVLLGPTINVQRTPLGGRTFECYSEDPDLTGELAVRYVQAVQAHHVAVTVKHFVCNDTEIERMRVDVDVDEATLREVYLRPFERAVRDGGAWGVMSAYNRLGGEHCAQSRLLLTDVLRGEWGFDGVVVSDWFGVHDTVPAATAGLTIEMPAPARVYGHHLVAAVERGDVEPSLVDDLVREVLVLANRTRADERPADGPETSVDDPAERALTRRAAIAGTVLLRNDHVAELDAPVLPLDPARLGNVAVVGPNAVIDRSMGGGSASLTPFGHRTLFDALRDRIVGADPGASVRWEPGVRIDRLAPVVRRDRLRTPDGQPGLRVEYVNGDDWDAPAVLETVNSSSQILFFGSVPDGVDPTGFGARLTGTYLPEVDGPHEMSMVAAGAVRMTATTTDDAGERSTTVVVDDPDMELPRTRDFFGAGSAEQLVTVDAVAGRPIELDVKWRSMQGLGFAAVRIGVRPPDPDDLLDRAVDAAAGADTAVVVVGTNDEWETEGFDREFMELPGEQDELVRRVVAANPNTVVVVNAGSPVTMDWADAATGRAAGSAPAILTSFFAGQEQAEAMVDVLTGAAEPAGRLPITFPVRLEDTPAYLSHEPQPGNGGPVQRYGEGPFVGHRWYAARRIEPRFWFGHGLSYGSVTWGDVVVEGVTADGSHLRRSADSLATDAVRISVPLRSQDTRDTPVVVQAYLAAEEVPGRPTLRRLAAWSKTTVAAGSDRSVELTLGADAFRRWDVGSGTWTTRCGTYVVDVAESANPADVHARVVIELD